MKLRTLIASFAALAGISIAKAATDATGIEPTLAATDQEAGSVRQAIDADFETVRVHARDLFAGAVGRTFSFYADPAHERQITLGSPVGLARNLRDRSKSFVLR